MQPFQSVSAISLRTDYFDMDKLQVDEVGEEVLKKQLWQCMISQALELKGDIETRRAGNTFGIIVWQYNEIWPTVLTKLPRYRWHLGCILLKMPAISLRTGASSRDGRRRDPRRACG